MKIYIINMAKSVQRRTKMQQYIDALPEHLDIEFVEAIDGQSLTESEITYHTKKLCMATTKGEIGCALSHINVYRKMAAENIPVALILEDDVKIPHDLSSMLEKLEKSIGHNEVLLLSRPKIYFKKAINTINNYKIFSVSEADLASSYIITHEAAKKMAEFLYPVWLLADNWGLVKDYKITSVNCLIPPFFEFNENEKETTITGRYIPEIKKNRDKIWRKIRRRRPASLLIKKFFWKRIIRRFNTKKFPIIRMPPPAS